MQRFLLILAIVCAAGVARAQVAPAANEPIPFALVVGSNAGGPGQQPLKYAHDDATRVGALLAELGGYPRSNVDVVLAPTPAIMRSRLDALAAKVKAAASQGRTARVTFYYSGHARATALDLGNAQMPLDELRSRLFAVSAQVTVVVLDACQSGAFSRVKGGSPAADFSFNSKSQLAATGVAVLASSTGSELSQESEQLRSSYFTHHLLVGMRGAGDANNDGLVTIDEAYRYAYHQTLLATAETAVGGQHVTFEVDLKGHGEVPMSYPRAATSSITLAAPIQGKALVSSTRSKTVVAELQKATGNSVRIAIAPGDYDVTVRDGELLWRCRVNAGPGGTSVDLGRCARGRVTASTSKGGGGAFFNNAYRTSVELLLGAERSDGYTQTLDTFGYYESKPAGVGFAFSLVRNVGHGLWVGGVLIHQQGPQWTRNDALRSLSIEWETSMLGPHAEYVYPLGDSGFWEHFAPYASASAGIALGRTSFFEGDESTRSTFLGPAVGLGAGLLLETHIVGFSLGYQWLYHRAIDNLTGDTHASGGHRISLGVYYGR